MSDQASTVAATELRLHYNENTAGCSPKVLEALSSMTRLEVGSYPDVGPITAKTAAYLGVAADRVLLTNGLDEGIQAAALWAARSTVETAVRPEIVITEPTFEMYGEFAAMVGARLVQLKPENDFRFPAEAMAAAITSATRAVYLADPNNPTGLPLPAGTAEAIAAAAPHALVFIDEAYADFSGRTLAGPLLDTHRNLIVGRTFAKGHGLAGLRIGAVIAHPDTVATLRSLVPPFSVNSCAIRGLDAALDDRSYLDWYVGETAQSRELVYAFCLKHGLPYWPSEANFVLIRMGPRTDAVVSALAARGIALRDKSSAPGCAGCIRLTAGVAAHTALALEALEEHLASRTN